MRKRELVGAIAQDVDLPPRDVARVVDRLFARLAETLLEDGRFEITGLGVFHVQELPERRTYVPKRKVVVVVPARRAVAFSEAKALKERLNPHGKVGEN